MISMPLERRMRRLAAFTIAVALSCSPIAMFSLGAQGITAADSARVASFAMTEVMIPMRDGVKLHTQIYTPKAQTRALPFILTRTPYGIAGSSGVFVTSYAEWRTKATSSSCRTFAGASRRKGSS
jgi:hypothetical protein